MVVDGVRLLVDMEKLLMKNESIDALIPKWKYFVKEEYL